MTQKSTIDLVIIGILMAKPRSAYDLNQFIEQGRINRVIKISAASVYKKCKKLAIERYIQGEIVQEGEMPEKSIYQVTLRGQQYFNELMSHYSSQIYPFFLEFNTVLVSLDQLPSSEAIEVLSSLINALEKFSVGVIQHENQIKNSASFSARAIVKQYRMLALTLVKWAKETKADYQKLIGA